MNKPSGGSLSNTVLITQHRIACRQMAYEATLEAFALWLADERQQPRYVLARHIWQACQRAVGEAQFGPDLATYAGRPRVNRLSAKKE